MKNRKLLIVFALLILFFSCKKDSKNFASDPNLFTEYIISYSSGLISSTSDIRAVLSFENINWQPNQELDSDLYEISPKVSGKVIAVNQNTLAFVPNEKLESDTEYFVSLNLKDLKEVPKELNQFKFVVKTYKQNFNIQIEDLQSYSKEFQYLNLDFNAADYLKSEDAAKLVTASQNGKKLKVKFKPTTLQQTHYEFYIDSIERKLNDSEIIIEWNGKSQNIDQKGELSFKIPGKNNFSVINSEMSQDENAILINFSDPVKGSQKFKGLVQLQETDNLKFVTAGNVLKIFLDEYVSGDKKLEVFAGILSEDNIKLKSNYTNKISIGSLNPSVEFIKSGSILPSSNDLKINFKAINLNAVDIKVFKVFKNNILQFFQESDYKNTYPQRKVGAPIARQTVYLNPNKLQKMNRWNTYAIDLSKLITPDPGTIYTVEISYKKSYAALECITEDITESEPFEENEGEVRAEYGYNDYYENYQDYSWEEREDPCTSSFYFNRSISTNVLATDLGVIVKRGENGNYNFIVTNIVTAQAEAAAEIKLYNYQQQLLTTLKTDAEGFANVKLSKYAYFAVVNKNENTTYIKLDEGNPLSLSNFNVDGIAVNKGLKGYIYGERGVWRPGDTLFLGFILNDLDSKLEKSHPVTLQVKDVQGKLKFKTVSTYNENQHYLFKVPTNQSDPTGNWEAKITVGGANFYKSIKVETIKPNRLKIKNTIEDKEIYAATNNPITIRSNWLHGAIAKNLKIDVQAKIKRGLTTFKNYEKFKFDDDVRPYFGEEINIYSGKLNDNGEVTFNFTPNTTNSTPGKLKAIIQTRVHENGGDFSTDVATATISPYKTYVGIKAPKTNKYGYLDTDKENIFEIQTVSENGNPKAVNNLKVEIYKIDWYWWWNSFEGQLTQYNYSDAKMAYKSQTISTNSSGKANFKLNVPEHDWGNYLFRVIDENGGHATSLTSIIDWPYWSGKTKNSGSETANTLMFTSDKEKYNSNETAKISIPTSVGGRALISIESGSQVVSTKWIDTKEGETIVEVPLTDKMTPNIYVHVTLLKPHAHTINDSPIRMYGVINLEVINENSKLIPQINMQKVLRPEQKTAIKVSEKNGKPMTYTIAIVDEGLLDLTRYKTPDAWKHFNTRLALGVKTWDIFNEVIGAYGGRINQVFSIGGDEDLGAGDAKKANRFEPVVRVLGPFTLDKNKTANHEINIPNYIGSVRTMVVASNVNENSYGSTEITTPVRKPLMVLASLPRKISPNEKVTLPVTIFAMENHVKNVQLEIKTSGKTKVLGSRNQSIYFENPDEKMAYFDLEVNDNEGIETIELIARSGKETATFKVEIDVVNPNPAVSRYTDFIISQNENEEINYETFGVNGSNKAILEISSIPTINLNGRLNYLIQYPHGCAEQITSIAFPQLFITDFVKVEDSKKASLQRNVNNTIAKLSKYQTNSGGFAYWPGNYGNDDWTSSYIGHFLIEAESKGYILQDGMKKKWLSYQQNEAKKWRFDNNIKNDIAQSYRLYTLALSGNADLASMNRLKEVHNLSDIAKINLSGAYALAKQLKIAKSIIKDIHNNTNFAANNYYGSESRNKAMLLDIYLLLKEDKKAYLLANELAQNLSSNQYMSTQTTAYSLYAMSKYILNMTKSDLKVTLNIDGKSETITTNKNLVEKTIPIGNKKISLKNNSGKTLYARVITTGILPIGDEISINNNLELKSSFTNRDGKEISLKNISQGTEIIATLTIKNTSNQNAENVALQQIIPSGFEIINLRYTDFGNSFENKADFIDIRDDRSMYYFSLMPNEIKTYKLVLNASYLGKYYLPGAYAETMYSNMFTARNSGFWVNIVSEN